ncbi:MAG: peptide deformylase [Candidatus Lokiarchaeota archaeon]|nr:peptide deformylase [Candidatus Lokiarchaeota archaeon]
MPARRILLLGNPKLYAQSDPVSREELGEVNAIVEDLHDTLMEFRNEWGAGRAIAAPQIGEFKRTVYVNIDEPVVLFNPKIVDRSKEMIELWDDCMSFPHLLVKVKRHRRITVEYRDTDWKRIRAEYTDDESELLQHEIDHLNGLLATQRALDSKSFALRSQRDLLQQ